MTLIGSRYVGKFDRDKSDYDFIAETPNNGWVELREWLESCGFKPQAKLGLGYGPDRYLHGTCVWTRQHDEWPSVDILPMTSEEASFRLLFFAGMKKAGDEKGGLLAKALKESRSWERLWTVLHGMESPEAVGE